MPRPVIEKVELPHNTGGDKAVQNWGGALIRNLTTALFGHGQRINCSIHQDGEVPMLAPLRLARYEFAELPDADEWDGSIAFATDAGFVGASGGEWTVLGVPPLVSATSWSVEIIALNGASDFAELTEIAFYDSGGNVITPDGTAIASSEHVSGNFPPADLFDGVMDNRWVSDTWAGGPQWAGMTFSEGKEVARIDITNHSVARSPTVINLRYSDDAMAWTDLVSYSGLTWGGLYQTQVFPVQ